MQRRVTSPRPAHRAPPSLNATNSGEDAITDRIEPPWDPETVEALNAYQAEAPMHPFTCKHRDRRDADRQLTHIPRQERDQGILVATPSGWICRDCDYRQLWAWPWMADNSWWKSMAQHYTEEPLT